MSIAELKPLLGRMGVALLLGLAIWNPGWHSTFSPINTIIVLDESQSMGDNTPDSAWQVSAANIATLPPGSRYSLIRFGADAVLESASRPNTELAGQPDRPHRANLDTTATNIEAALRLAAQQLEGKTEGLMILITDGGETSGDSTALLSRFQEMGLPAPYLLAPGCHECFRPRRHHLLSCSTVPGPLRRGDHDGGQGKKRPQRPGRGSGAQGRRTRNNN